MSQKISAEQFLNAIGKSSKLSGADILNSLLNSDGNIHMKADISDPAAYTAMHVKANWLEQVGMNVPSQRYRDIANLAEQFSVSRRGNRANMVAESLVSVMVQEFEKEKMSAKFLVGR